MAVAAMQRSGRVARVLVTLTLLAAISMLSVIRGGGGAAGDAAGGSTDGARAPPALAQPPALGTRSATAQADTDTPLRPWMRWNACWARGRWRRLDEQEISAKSYLYAYRVATQWMDNYTWAVDPAPGCPEYKRFDNAGFCAALRGRDVVMFGDSLTGQFATALMYMVVGSRAAAAKPLRRDRFPYVAPNGPLFEGCTDWGFTPRKFVNLLNWAQGHLRLSNALGTDRTISRRCNATGKWACRHVVLTPGSPEDRVYGIDEFLTEWAPQNELNPGVIIINHGAHYSSKDALLREARAALVFITQTFPGAAVVWRSTVPGHVNCSRIAAPLSEPQDLSSVNPAWHWAEFGDQNALVRDLIAHEFPTVVYMDVYTAGVLRGDLHVSYFKSPPDNSDCLHHRSGMPSPTDHWVELLYNVLLQKNSEL
jgi:hypothetical protein